MCSGLSHYLMAKKWKTFLYNLIKKGFASVLVLSWPNTIKLIFFFYYH